MATIQPYIVWIEAGSNAVRAVPPDVFLAAIAMALFRDNFSTFVLKKG